jgi:putative NADH-flavin reductase
VKPVRLTDGPSTGNYRVGERLNVHGLPKISRADVAHFVLTQLTDPTYSRKTAVIGS